MGQMFLGLPLGLAALPGPLSLGHSSSHTDLRVSFPLWQMFDWITHNKGLFLNSYTEIGTSHPHAMDLQTQHNHFAMNCMVRHGWKCTRPTWTWSGGQL